MPFTLSYRRGSFPSSEVYASRLSAIDRACAMIMTNGSYAFMLEEDGVLLLSDSEIVSECLKAGCICRRADRPLLR